MMLVAFDPKRFDPCSDEAVTLIASAACILAPFMSAETRAVVVKAMRRVPANG
jgi:hypothetical protein